MRQSRQRAACQRHWYGDDHPRQPRRLAQCRRRKPPDPGFRVQAIDTIAAGDTFNGALVTALLEGTALPEAIRFAHAAAAIAVTRKGAQPSVPWRTEIDEFLAQQG